MSGTILKHDIQMVVIGTSAGGVDALSRLLPCFKTPSELSVAVVIHLPSHGKNLIPSLLSPDCKFKVKEAEPGEKIEKETIYLAPPDYHLSLEPNHQLSLSSEELVNFSRPSIDILFESAAYAYQENLLGILLTGSNNDGARGLKSIQEQGGITLVQNPKDLDYPVMPKSALDLMKPDGVFTLDEIASFLSTLSRQGKKNG